MDNKRISAILNIIKSLDNLTTQKGLDHPEIIDLWKRFYEVSDKEFLLEHSHHYPYEGSKIDDFGNNLKDIRSVLNIRATQSIDYSFISNEKVRNQLSIDNLRMENSRLNLSVKDDDRFISFSINAFHQVEELINYYYATKLIFDDLKERIVIETFCKKRDISNISEIAIACKIFLFEKDFYYRTGFSYDSVMTKLRLTRNEGLHRCNLIIKDEIKILSEYELLRMKMELSTTHVLTSEEKHLENEWKLIHFLKEKNFDLVRNAVRDLAEKVKNNIL